MKNTEHFSGKKAPKKTDEKPTPFQAAGVPPLPPRQPLPHCGHLSCPRGGGEGLLAPKALGSQHPPVQGQSDKLGTEVMGPPGARVPGRTWRDHHIGPSPSGAGPAGFRGAQGQMRPSRSEGREGTFSMKHVRKEQRPRVTLRECPSAP